jgi:hypothetical protein
MTIVKVDIDVKMDKELLYKFVTTRFAIMRALNYTPCYYEYKETSKGYHFWFGVEEELSSKEICDLQFLLGDDHSRCRFNYLRLDAGCFKQFNVLFSKKLKNNNIT